MRLNIYLAGPMRGKPGFNYPAFDFAATKLREAGHTVFSPAEHDRKALPSMAASLDGDPTDWESKGFSLRDAMAEDLYYICTKADALALLPGWQHSEGALIESALANMLGLTIIILGKECVA